MRVNPEVLAANEDIAQKWLSLVASYDHHDAPRSRIEAIASRYRQGQPCRVIQRFQGAFNYCFRVRFDDGDDDWMIRFPIPGYTMNALEKTQNEAAVMRFIQTNTAIPIPKIIGSGVADGEFEGLGPYIVMEFVQGISLDDLILEEDGAWALRKDCPIDTIKGIYRQIASIYLELFKHNFSQIGSLSVAQNDDVGPNWSVTSRPLTFKMNEVERMGGVRVGGSFANLPVRHYLTVQSAATDGIFDLPVEYFQALADQSLSHLSNNPRAGRNEQEIQQDHDSIRMLQSLAGHFGAKSDRHQHKLFCDDLRFGNILVDESYRIVAVLDWEFCYVAPQSFLCSPPSWLIGSEPFEWKDCDVSFYKEQVDLFLALLEEEEEKRHIDHELSRLMRESMQDGAFWYNLAVRESFPLSDILAHCRDIGAFQKANSSSNLESGRQDYSDQVQAPQWWKGGYMSPPLLLSTAWQDLQSFLPFLNRLTDWLNHRSRDQDVHVDPSAGGR
ncbi:hypothetical protein HIM_09287 [Hirsutella minnesotensis 3608]|uniref:Aminoglycoside phosphotransferase domain-containing protein n=1 Tax=Hirsutella minnesotensis 3608 TaxID=1043627 RepID=A0A0F7ZSG3_9HYPO|nr:hypothetical protein HIM_09287 [Hirsutella minnesotensis 3608]